jgi:hypothetical protein
MTTGSTDSDENTVSDGETVPETPSTDSLPLLTDPSDAQFSDLPDRPARAHRPIASKGAPASAKFPVENDYVSQHVRIGQLTLTVDNADFAYGIQCGIDYARECLQPAPTSMQELLNECIELFKSECKQGDEAEYATAFGELLGAICHLVNGTRRLDFRLGPKPINPWVNEA